MELNLTDVSEGINKDETAYVNAVITQDSAAATDTEDIHKYEVLNIKQTISRPQSMKRQAVLIIKRYAIPALMILQAIFLIALISVIAVVVHMKESERVVGEWSEWSFWTTCSVSCGSGLQRRTRSCVNYDEDSKPCVGDTNDYQLCNTQACGETPVGEWSEWSVWTSCSVSCSSGVQKRTRSCQSYNEDSKHWSCVGDANDYQLCHTKACRGFLFGSKKVKKKKLDSQSWKLGFDPWNTIP